MTKCPYYHCVPYTYQLSVITWLVGNQCLLWEFFLFFSCSLTFHMDDISRIFLTNVYFCLYVYMHTYWADFHSDDHWMCGKINYFHCFLWLQHLDVYGTSKVANIWFLFGMKFWANLFFFSLSSPSLIPQPACLISEPFNHVINVKQRSPRLSLSVRWYSKHNVIQKPCSSWVLFSECAGWSVREGLVRLMLCSLQGSGVTIMLFLGHRYWYWLALLRAFNQKEEVIKTSLWYACMR